MTAPGAAPEESLATTTVFVTGATGFIGQHLIRKLLASGYAVRGLAHRASPPVGVQGMAWQQGDLLDQSAMVDATRGVDVVCQLAAQLLGRGGRAQMWRTNVEGTECLARACVENGVRRFVHLSSVSAYAVPLPAVVTEAHPIGGYDSYGHSKAAAEDVLGRVAAGALHYTILRPCQVFGAGDTSAYTERLRKLCQGHFVLTAGARPRPFSIVAVEDVANAVVATIGAQSPSGRAYNVASPAQVSLQSLLRAAQSPERAPPATVPIPRMLMRAAFEWRWVLKQLQANGLRPRYKSYGTSRLHGSLFLGGPRYAVDRAEEELAFRAKASPEEVLRSLDQGAP
ncbi:MAG: NAD-dependent epimerase/dehydratase family protein [Pseudomonadota bacterium]